MSEDEIHSNMKEVRGICFIILMALSPIINGQTIIPGGYVSGEWTAAGSPYLVQGNLVVHPDSGDIHRIDVSRLPSGLYMIILSNEAYQFSGKIIIIP